MLLLQERDTELCRLQGGNDRDRALFFNSFFFHQLLNPTTNEYNYSAVAKWTKYDVFLLKRLYFPLNYPVNSHWTLFTVDINLRLIRYYDPMSGEANSHANILKRWLLDEAKDKDVREFIDVEWTVKYVKHMPKQTGSTACGVLLILCANCLSLDKQFDYDMDSVPEARVNIGCAILSGCLGKIEGLQKPLDLPGSWVEDIMSGRRLSSKLQLNLVNKKDSEALVVDG